MPTAQENINTAINNAALAIAAWDCEKVNYTDQGRSEQWTTQYLALLDALERLQKAKQLAGGPIMVRSYGRA